MSKSTKMLISPLKPSPVPWNPHPYQEKAIKRGLRDAAVGFLLDPGLGKTSIILAIVKILLRRKLVSKVLVIAPLRVAVSTWPSEIEKWTDFRGIRYALLHGPKKDQALKSDADIYFINPEGLEWLIKPEKIKRGKKTSVRVDARAFAKLGFDVLVVDELTKFKNTASIRFKMFKQVLHTFSRRYGLTGSPAANGLMGLFGQIYILDTGRSLGSFITHYRTAYFTPSFNGFSYDLQPGAEDRIYERISPVTMRMSSADYLKLPQLIENVIKLEMPEPALNVYLELEKTLFTQLGNGETLTAKNTGVALNKCRQVASGAIYKESDLGELAKPARRAGREWMEIHDTKVEALADLVDELQGSPALVVYEFHHDLQRIQARFKKDKIDVPAFGGGVNVSEGKRLEALWNRGELPILAAHPASIAHGLNLQGAGQHIIWFTLTWDYENFTQLIDRLRRQGSKNTKIFNHILVMEDTVEEAVLAAIRGKARLQNQLFDALKDLQSRRRRRA